ncbi:MAG: hypothetical protein ACYTG5_17860, partial [Planctomycetota bacterium]
MKSCFVPLLMLGACTLPPAIPGEVIRDLLDAPQNGAVRVLIQDGEAVQWIVSLDPRTLPESVRRASEAVLQEGEFRFIGRFHGASEPAFFLEKTYPDQSADHVRKAIIADDGRILLRSHSLALSEVPVAARKQIEARGRLESLEFIQDDERSFYRAVFQDSREHRGS